MTVCFHCNETCQQEIFAELDGNRRSFCCSGCRSVAEMIFAQGLQSYYLHRTHTASKANLVPDEWLIESTQAHVVDGGTPLASITLFIADINCAACSWLIERSLRQLPGVKTVSSSLLARRTLIEWDDTQTSVQNMLQQLQRLGYRALPYSPDHLEQTLERENLALLKRLAVAAFGMMQAMMYTFGLYFGLISDLSGSDASWLRWAGLFCTAPVVIYSATPFYRNAWRALGNGAVNMDLSVSLGILAAFVVSGINTMQAQGHVYFDSIAMFVFLLLGGRYLEARLRDAANKTAALQQRLLPSHVLCWRRQQWQTVPLQQIKTGDHIRVSAGEVLAIDGEILAGEGYVDERIISGESLPLAKAVGSTVLAGSLVQGGSIDVCVSAEGQRTFLAQLGQLQDKALADRPSWQLLADRIAHHFVIAVIIIAIASYFFWQQQDASRSIDVLLAVLVVTCPCALSLALPTAWAAATKQLLQHGFLIRRAQTLAALASITTIVVDKTGTLTSGQFALDHVQIFSDLHRDRCLKIAAALEQHSRHSLARAFAAYVDPDVVALDVTERAGIGVSGTIADERYFVGRFEELAPTLRPVRDDFPIYLASTTALLAGFALHDQLRTDAHHFVRRLQTQGLNIVLASGDRASNVMTCANALAITDVHARLLPEQKLALVRRLQQRGETVLMIGDGINDAPVLAGADASIAVGEGGDFARRAADAVLNRQSLTVICDAIDLARRTHNIVRQNILWAIAYNVVALPSALLGILSPWEAALGMSLSSLLVTLNSTRLQWPQRELPHISPCTDPQSL